MPPKSLKDRLHGHTAKPEKKGGLYYYEQKEPVYFALVVFCKATTIFGLVVWRLEFWILLGVHCTAMGLFKVGIWDPGDLQHLSGTWEAVNTLQMFMVFLLTFYNGRCYQRYTRLYESCMEALDGAIFFVQEIVVSLSPASAEKTRVRSVKYILAMLHIFFVGLTGHMKSKNDWKEIVDRGLLTKLEAEQLQKYPAMSIETILVISTWTMQIVDRALEHDAFWTKRSMRIAHTHNRMTAHMTQILRAMHDIGDELANPMPFGLYHTTNVVLLFNLSLLCVLTSVFKTYQTVFPLMVSLLFFLGLREVAVNLSDPFHGRGFGSDFPIESFLQHVFDSSVCLLEGFRHGDPEEFTRELVARQVDFGNEQLRHVLPNTILYTPDYDATVVNPFSWHREHPLTHLGGHDDCPTVGYTGMLQDSTMIPAEGHLQEIYDKWHYHQMIKPSPARTPTLWERFCKKPKKDDAAAVEIPGPENRIDAEIKLEKQETKNQKVEEQLDMWKAEVEKLKVLLEHRIKVGKDLNLPVEKVVAKAMSKEKEELDIEKARNRRLAPEFTSYDELRKIMAHAAETT